MKREKKEKSGSSRSAGVGFLFRFLMFFGGLEDRFRDSAIVRKISSGLRRLEIPTKVIRPAASFVSREISQSALLGLINRFFDLLLRLPVRAYGAFLLAFTGGATVARSLHNYRSGEGLISVSSVIFFGIFAFLSLILLSVGRTKSMGRTLCEGRVTSYLLFDLLGLRKNAFENASVCDANYAAVLIAAVLLSIFSLWISPASIAFAALWVFYIRLAACSPESGLIATLFAYPLVSSDSVVLMIAFVGAGYIVKLLRGKRNFSASFFGFFILLFSILALFGVVMTPAGGEGVSFKVCFAVLAAFFLSFLLMDRRELIRRAASALSLSAVLSSLWTSLMFAASYLPEQYKSVVSAITLYKTPFGLTSQGAGVLIGISSVILISRFLKAQSVSGRILMIAGAILLGAGAIVSRSPAAWFALIAALFFLLVFNKRSRIIPLTLTVAAFVLVYVFLPTFITNYVRYFSVGFSSSVSGVFTQLGQSLSRAFVGAGEAGAAAEGNFYSHVLWANGAIGLLFLLTGVFGILSYAYYAVVKNALISRQMRSIIFGFSSAVCAFSVAGFFLDPYGDEKMLLVFFSLLGLIVACARVLLREGEQEMRRSELDVDFVFVPLSGRRRKKDAKGENDAPLSYIFEEKAGKPERRTDANAPEDPSDALSSEPPDERAGKLREVFSMPDEEEKGSAEDGVLYEETDLQRNEPPLSDKGGGNKE